MDDIDPSPQSDVPPGEDSSSPIERRLVMRLLRIWRDKAEPDEMPTRERFNVDELCDSKPYCWTATIGGDAADTRFDWIGEAYEIDDAAALIGQPIAASPEGTLIARASAYARNVVTWRVPMSFGGELKHRRGSTLLFRSIILPLRGPAGEISHLLGAANYRTLP